MATQMQLRGGTTAENLVFTGAQREITVDTDKHAVVVHDGVTAGGYPMATSPQVTNGTFYFNDNTGGGSAANAYILTPKSNTNTPTQYTDGLQLGFVTANANTGGPATATFSGLGVRNLKYPGGVDPSAGDIFGRVYVIYDSLNGWFEIQRKATGPSPQIRPITGSVTGNGLVATAQPQIVEFRSSSLNNGAINSRSFVTGLTLTAPAGATLGTTNGVLSRIAVLYIDNAGAVELAFTNASNSTILFDETGLISTTAISAAASSANVVYSATSLGAVPYRVAGFIESTQTTAGQWSVTPSKVQGQGGQALIGLSFAKSGYGTPQNTTSGTSVDITGIPSWAKKITLILNGVSTTGSTALLAQIGAGSIQTTGYNCASVIISTTVNNTTISTFSNAGQPTAGGNAAAISMGSVIFYNVSGNSWVSTTGGYITGAVWNGGGNVSLSGTLDRIRLTTLNGTDVFDLGSINIIYEG